uniref:G-protein coupled receptors family 2 profile 1 domain-containing protein n=1 Tax=Romanomermis culicivorax TaxID=13658 RepID=A0A915KRJ6_ROMCU
MNDDTNRNYPHLAQSLESCISDLTDREQPTHSKDGSLWCNATWDTLLCWPAIAANTSYRLPCPPLRGLDLEKFVTKYCDETGRWAGRAGDEEFTVHGYTDYNPCVPFDLATYE